MSDGDERVATGYDVFYGAWGRSPTLARIWRDHVTGPDYPEAFAHISFLRLRDLQALADGLALRDGDVVVDLACGAGGPGLWVASASGARLIGRDLSAVAVERARERVAGVGLEGRAEFATGTFERTGLAAASADAAMTVDALQYAPDKARALREVARIVRPGGRFAFAAFELDAHRVAGLDVWSDPVGDYRPLLEREGFRILTYRQIEGWEDDVAAGFGAVVAERAALETELGEGAAGALMLEASITLELRPYRGHVLAVAERT